MVETFIDYSLEARISTRKGMSGQTRIQSWAIISVIIIKITRLIVTFFTTMYGGMSS